MLTVSEYGRINELGADTMTLTNFCGRIAIGVSCLVVMFFVGLIILAGICLVMGAYESTTNPNAANQTAQEYQEAQHQIQTGVSHIQKAVPAGAGP